MSLISLWTSANAKLESFRWKNRVLLLFAPSPQDERLTRQLSLIETNRAGFEDRDFLVFSSTSGSPADALLRSRFHVQRDAYAVILIGKDGTAKLRQSSVIPPEKIFRLVDSMPMRQAGGR